MAKNPILNENYLFLQEIYKNLFTLMVNDANFYVCLVKVNATDTYYKAYLEHPPEDATAIVGILRVFLRKDDADSYAQLIAQSEAIDLSYIKRWEASFAEILGYARNLEGKHKTLGLPGLRVVTSVIANDDLVDADIFWTTEQEKMV